EQARTLGLSEEDVVKKVMLKDTVDGANGQRLSAGDALKTDEPEIEIKDGTDAEVLLFDLPGERGA
ncbi:MAG TPA: hypothetical protein VLI21_17160, partial [Casimicrobiaceae bacterium]|nr:hypothetical protein [Casimicrobiaceae bacterium]